MALWHLIQSPRLWPAEDGGLRRVTWLELFFDLIFVAAVAQVEAPLSESYTWSGVFRFLAFFALIWWAWVGHTLYSTRFDTDDLVQRLLTLIQMFAVAAMAANAKDAFDSRYSAGFAAAYAAMRLVLVFQYWRARCIPKSRKLATHYATGFGIAALVWIVSAVVDPPARYWLWGLALAVDLGTPLLALHHAEKTPPDAAHLPERFGLFTIILLGESIVAVMRGMESQESWTLSAALSAFQGMAIAFCFWWWYFDGARGAAERPIRNRKQAFLFHVWSYAHWPLYIGIALSAAGVKHVVSLSAGARLHSTEAWILCGSVTLAMISITVVGMTSESPRLRLPVWSSSAPHFSLAVLALLGGFAGTRVAPVWLVGGLAVLSGLQAGFSLRERRAEQKTANLHSRSARMMSWCGLLLVVSFGGVLAVRQLLALQKSPAPRSVRIVRLDKRFDKLVPRDAEVKRIAEGFAWVEGPVWHRRGNYLLFSDIPNNSIFKWTPCGGAELFLKPSGYTGSAPFPGREPGSNGLAFDREGRPGYVRTWQPAHRTTGRRQRQNGARRALRGQAAQQS